MWKQSSLAMSLGVSLFSADSVGVRANFLTWTRYS